MSLKFQNPEYGHSVTAGGLTHYWVRPHAASAVITHREDGPARIHKDGTEEWRWLGEKHRVDGPAMIFPNGREEWWLNDKRHRVDGPAVIDPSEEREEWWVNHMMHREDGPAKILPYYRNGPPTTPFAFNSRIRDGFLEQWIYGGQFHREGGPAVICADLEQWWECDMTHRIDGPAETTYDSDHKILVETWYIRGKKHRWDGPAVIRHDTGEKEYWIDGKRVDRLAEILENCQIEGSFAEWTEGEWTILRLALTEDLVNG
jgi:hypothetical protein